MLLPSEHGAWGMLLLPFVAGATLGRRWDLDVFVSLLAVLLAFVIREPLTVLARQTWVWRLSKPESQDAKRALAWQGPLLLACGLYLWTQLPRAPLVGLAAVGALMTGTAVWMTVHNKRRSATLQVVSSFTLATTALLAALATTGALPGWSWPLWALMSIHSVIGVFSVHARLERKLKHRANLPAHSAKIATALTALAAAAAVGCWLPEFQPYAAPLAFSALASGFEMFRLTQVAALEEPFTRVGMRMLLVSIVHGAVVVGVLWQASGA